MLLNCKGKLKQFDSPLVMGILNITDNSFYKGFLKETERDIVSRAGQMFMDGADIIDIGGQSTKPGSERISATEEMRRILPLIDAILKEFPDKLLSVDTYYAEVAKAAVEHGVSIVNDVSGGELDNNMIAVVASLRVPYICMHMKGTPETMQHNPQYNDILTELTDYFHHKIKVCSAAGIKDVIIDPGFGFGKTIENNFTILKNLEAFAVFEKPVLAGLSRKSTVYKTLGISAEEALNGTTVLHTLALQNGASILRVHDVKEAREAVLLVNAYKKAAY